MSTAAIELPLFPLQVVLFPGTLLPLHIFESRYRQMIIDCLQENKPFGVVLVRPESEHLQEIPHTVGTMAEIRNVDRLDDGRYILMVVGTKRFRILSQHREKPYLSGLVEPYDDLSEPGDDLLVLADQVKELFSMYLEMLLEATEEQEVTAELPSDAQELSYFVAYLMDTQDEKKQQLLEINSTRQRLQEELSILRREVPFMREILRTKMPDERAQLN